MGGWKRLFVESANRWYGGGDVAIAESREMLSDRQLQRIVTEGTFRHARNCARSRITRKITTPGVLARFCCESKHAFLLFYQLRTNGRCPIFYWPFSSLNTQPAKTSRHVWSSGGVPSRYPPDAVPRNYWKTSERKGKGICLFSSMGWRYKFFARRYAYTRDDRNKCISLFKWIYLWFFFWYFSVERLLEMLITRTIIV